MPEFEIPSGNEFIDQDMDYESLLSFFEEALIMQVDANQTDKLSLEPDDSLKGAARLGDKMQSAVHTTQSGDTYGGLSKKYDVSVEDLRRWNGYYDTKIPVDTDLIVSQPTLTDEGMLVLADKAAKLAYDAKGRKNAISYDYTSDVMLNLYNDEEVLALGNFLSHGDIINIANIGNSQISVLKRATFLHFRDDTYDKAVNVTNSNMSVSEQAEAIVDRNTKMYNDFGLSLAIFDATVTVFTLGQSFAMSPFIPTPKSFVGPRPAKLTYSGSGGKINFASTPSLHMKNPNRYVPVQIQQAALKGKAYPDPKGSAAKMYYTKMYRGGKPYNLEVLYHKKSNSIWHFEYSRKAMGPLPAIK